MLFCFASTCFRSFSGTGNCRGGKGKISLQSLTRTLVKRITFSTTFSPRTGKITHPLTLANSWYFPYSGCCIPANSIRKSSAQALSLWLSNEKHVQMCFGNVAFVLVSLIPFFFLLLLGNPHIGAHYEFLSLITLMCDLGSNPYCGLEVPNRAIGTSETWSGNAKADKRWWEFKASSLTHFLYMYRVINTCVLAIFFYLCADDFLIWVFMMW